VGFSAPLNKLLLSNLVYRLQYSTIGSGMQ
jgi:hypothetical protein